MALRLIDVYIPEDTEAAVREYVNDNTDWSILGSWSTSLGAGRAIVKILVDVEETEAITDYLSEQFAGDEDFRIIVMGVEATVPVKRDVSGDDVGAPETEVRAGGSETIDDPASDAPDEHGSSSEEREGRSGFGRVGREEIYHGMLDAVKVTPVYFVLVLLSTVVASIGLMRDNVAIIIGAMVIAPLLGPNIALALASILGDSGLGRKAVKASVLGVGLALSASVLFGVLFDFNPAAQEIASRTQVGVADIVLALSAGGAGALSLTAAVPSGVIGVMVAVALLPPLAVSGILAGGGYWAAAGGALLLLAVNMICVNLAAVLTFLVQGIRPSRWWEAQQARRASRWALAVSAGALALLTLLILESGLL